MASNEIQNSSNLAVVEHKGIYRATPTYPSTLKGLRALILGANGISGNHLVRVLSQAPERWTEVVAMSRRPPVGHVVDGKQVRHVQADLLQEPTKLAQILKDEQIQADVVFFFAYIQPTPKEGATLWSNDQELCDVNGKLLQNCFDALELASIRPKRFLLQTGGKHYGGGLAFPAVESDERVVDEKNFYYVQEDALFEYSRKTGVEWNVVRPSFIVGAVPDAAMNTAYGLALYAAVQKHKGEKLNFPGDQTAWGRDVVQSSAMLNSYLSEFVTLNDGAGNQAFNAADSCSFSYGRLWIEMAKWYGIEYTLPESEGLQEHRSSFKRHLKFSGPIVFKFKFTLTQWARRPENKLAWQELAAKHNLKGDPFGSDSDKIFEFLDWAVLSPYSMTFSMSKARSFGWNAYVDPLDSHREAIEELATMKVVPPM